MDQQGSRSGLRKVAYAGEWWATAPDGTWLRWDESQDSWVPTPPPPALVEREFQNSLEEKLRRARPGSPSAGAEKRGFARLRAWQSLSRPMRILVAIVVSIAALVPVVLIVMVFLWFLALLDFVIVCPPTFPC